MICNGPTDDLILQIQSYLKTYEYKKSVEVECKETTVYVFLTLAFSEKTSRQPKFSEGDCLSF
jgi:hypothetical protein